MQDDPLCGRCGHPRHKHRHEMTGMPLPSGNLYEGFHGRCEHFTSNERVFVHGLGSSRSFHSFRCLCSRYAVDRLPYVTELLGFEARSVVD